LFCSADEEKSPILDYGKFAFQINKKTA